MIDKNLKSLNVVDLELGQLYTFLFIEPKFNVQHIDTHTIGLISIILLITIPNRMHSGFIFANNNHHHNLFAGSLIICFLFNFQ